MGVTIEGPTVAQLDKSIGEWVQANMRDLWPRALSDQVRRGFDPEPTVHRPPSCRPVRTPSTIPEPAAQFHVRAYGQRPRPWSSTAHASSPTSRRSPSTTSEPCSGIATSLTVYW